jgi:hypothetical protein
VEGLDQVVGVRRHLSFLLLSLLIGTAGFGGAVRPPLTLALGRLRPGDLLFRSGLGWRADAVRLGDRGGFSHVGLLDYDRRLGWVVIHAAPPEDGDAGGVERVPLASFLSPDMASAAIVYRYKRLDPAGRAKIFGEARALAARKVPFDDHFDLSSRAALYCTELILDLYGDAGRRIRTVSRDQGSWFRANIVMPGDIMRSPDLTEVTAGAQS